MHDPHGARVQVRAIRYPNIAAEQQATKSVDEQVFDRVRVFERLTVESARGFEAKANETCSAAASLAAEIRELSRAIEDGAAGADGATADQWDKMRGRATELIKALTRATNESEWHAKKAEDPYGNFVALMRKYPALNRNIQP